MLDAIVGTAGASIVNGLMDGGNGNSGTGGLSNLAGKALDFAGLLSGNEQESDTSETMADKRKDNMIING